MLVKLIMKVLSNLLGNNSKIKYTEIGVQKDSEILNIKEYVDNGDVYSFNEVKTNKIWIDGKPIYRKVINFGSLPNASSKEVNSNISDLDDIIKLTGVALAQDKTCYVLPYVSTTSSNYFIDLTFTATQTIRIRTAVDRSNMNGYVILEYTKTTD